MELLLNELSLKGQFNSIEEFVHTALPPLLSVFKETDSSRDLLYKNYDFYTSMVTPDIDLYSIVHGSVSREYDEIRRFKTRLAGLFEQPYWEDNPKHSSTIAYQWNGIPISGSSLAEACERDKISISFLCNNFNNRVLKIVKENSIVLIDNLFSKGHYLEVLKERRIISFEQYCIVKFQGSKLDFSQIYTRDGFELITADTEDLFFDSFRKFEELTWPQILVDDALEYKEYNNRRYFKEIDNRIKKFRISQKYRCFGYVNNGVFYVLMFDITHKLSDKG